MSMSTPSDLADRFAPKLVGGSEDALRRALYFHNSVFDRQFHTQLVFENEDSAQGAHALLLGAGARAELRRTPPHYVDATFNRRLVTRVARIAAEMGGRIQVPHGYPQPRPHLASPHDRPTDLRHGYEAPKSVADRVQAAAAVCEALRDMSLPLEYLVTAEGEHRLVVGDGELSLEGLSARDREVFERLEDFLELTARLDLLVT